MIVTRTETELAGSLEDQKTFRMYRSVQRSSVPGCIPI